MCYFEHTRWRCGYWKWGNFRQQCNKEYRTGETCGLKLVYDTTFKDEDCKLCEQNRKKDRRYRKMEQDVERWRREGNRWATIEKTLNDIADIQDAMNKISYEHQKRLVMVGDYTDRSSISAEPSSESVGVLSTAHPTTFEPVVLPILESRPDWLGALSGITSGGRAGADQHVRTPIQTQAKTEGMVAPSGRSKQNTSSPIIGRDHVEKVEALSVLQMEAPDQASPLLDAVPPSTLDLKARPIQPITHDAAEMTTFSARISRPDDAHRRHTIAKAIADPHARLLGTYEDEDPSIVSLLSRRKLAQTNEARRPSAVMGDQREPEKDLLQVARPDSVTDSSTPRESAGSLTSSDDESFAAKVPGGPKQQMLDRLLAAFDVLWHETWAARTLDSGGSPPGDNHRTLDSGQKGFTSAATEKRKRLPGDDGDDNSEEAPGGHAPPPDDQRESTDPRIRRLACPYHQRNPDRHTSARSCKGAGFLGAHRVKEHLYNRHELPIRCPRCLTTFSTESDLEDHQRQDEPCKKQTEYPPPEGFNQKQKALLKKKMQGSDEHKWRTIYRVLFPDDREEDIPSPYVYDRGTGDLERYVSFMGRETKRRVRQKIEKTISVELAPLEMELLSRLPDLVLETQQEIYRDYRSAKAAPPASNPPLSSVVGPSKPGATASPQDLSSALLSPVLPPDLFTYDPTFTDWCSQQLFPDIGGFQCVPQPGVEQCLYGLGPAPERDGERAAREAFEQDHPGAIVRIPTSSTGLRCGWEALVRSWQSLRDRLERQHGILYGDITVHDLDRVYRREAARNPDFLMENNNMFRIDQMAIVVSELLLESCGIHVQLGYVHPHRGQAHFAVLVPYQEGVQPHVRLWVFNNNASAADWNNAHFEGIRDADISGGQWHGSCTDEDSEEGCESCALDEQLSGKGKGICLHRSQRT